MNKKIKIKTNTNNYNIYIKKYSIVPSIEEEKKISRKIFIIIDSKVLYCIKKLKLNQNITIIKIDGSEKIKSIATFSKLTSKLLKLKIDRSSTIFAIGGGTVGDLSGFIASTLLRGIKFILIPTTLLSQVDSSIGGKNGINTAYGKNLIGTFMQPNKVIIDPTVLKTLSIRELKSGYAEILKHGLIKDKKFYKWLTDNYKRILKLEEKYLIQAIYSSIKIKAKFVERDEKEKLINNSSRAMLNLGHTFGHALESLYKFNNKLTHGEAISIGMALASKISNNLKLITLSEYNILINHLKKVGLPFYDKSFDNEKIYNIMMSDKKNSNNKINLKMPNILKKL